MRGEKFQFDDGIGCEACHGGAETWIDSHTADATHEENLAAGMFPTEDLAARAELCMSCHVGTGKKFATHRIMGAGHPRLAFELDTFGVLQPQHYRVDADYEARKGDFSSFRNWVQGLVATAKQTLNLIQSSRFDNNRVYPELALFDCHACHHPMDDQRWRSREVTRGLGPGELRLNDASLVMLAAVAEVLSPGAHQEMVRKLRTMHTSVRKTRRDVLAAPRALEQTVDQLGDQFRSVEISNSNMQKILGKLFKEGARGQYQDYVAAEQTAMAVDLLIIAMGEQDKYTALIDRLYSSVQNEHRFNARNFQKNLAALQSRTGY